MKWPALLLPLLSLQAAEVHADLWAYVDEQGRSHVANRQVDARYKLFFKGPTTLDVPDAFEDQRARALSALSGTRLYERATDGRRIGRFVPLIETHARASAVESAFDPLARSAKGAIGLMQVIPETGARYGLAGDERRSIADKLLDPATNVRIGTRYLRDLLARFDDDLPLALAAYNAGEGAVAVHDNAIPPFAETRDFVRTVQYVYALYRSPPVQPERSSQPLRLRSSASTRSNIAPYGG
jgi:hypothetical protein